MAEKINYREKKVFGFMKMILFYVCTVIIIAVTSQITKKWMRRLQIYYQ